MPERVPQQTWVEIHAIVLEGGSRAPQVPPETQQVPLEMRLRGFLAQEAAIGDEVDIVTPAGRVLRGRLSAVQPPYTHMYGAPIPELLAVGAEARALLRTEEQQP